jgi:hypothetical protein
MYASLRGHPAFDEVEERVVRLYLAPDTHDSALVRTRELPPPEELNKPRDGKPIEMVGPAVWTCRHCDPDPFDPHRGMGVSSVQWVRGPHGEDYGRCVSCGQKFVVQR